MGFALFSDLSPPSPIAIASSRQKRPWFLVTAMLTDPLPPPWYILCHRSFHLPPHWNWCPCASPVYIKSSSALPLSSVSVVLLPCLLLPMIYRAFPLFIFCLFLFLCCACSCTLIGIRTTHRAGFVSICTISLHLAFASSHSSSTTSLIPAPF